MALAMAGCNRNPDTYRYVLTLTFRVHGVLRSGSSVVQVSPRIVKTIDAPSDVTRIHGQATVVDLGNGKYVFGLLTGTGDAELRVRCRRCVTWGQTVTPLLIYMNSLQDYSEIKTLSGTRTLVLDHLPSLVTFDNIRDPSTAVFVDPHDVQHSLGNDVTFVGATLEVGSKEPVTTGIERILPWLRWHGRRPIDPSAAYCTGICYFTTDFELANDPVSRFLMQFD
jgi:hypothetical protein